MLGNLEGLLSSAFSSKLDAPHPILGLYISYIELENKKCWVFSMDTVILGFLKDIIPKRLMKLSNIFLGSSWTCFKPQSETTR